jgi:hypothetical protein
LDFVPSCLGFLHGKVASLLVGAASADIIDVLEVDKLTFGDYDLIHDAGVVLKVAVDADLFGNRYDSFIELVEIFLDFFFFAF